MFSVETEGGIEVELDESLIFFFFPYFIRYATIYSRWYSSALFK